MRIDMKEIERIGGIENGSNRDIAEAVRILRLNDLLLPDSSYDMLEALMRITALDPSLPIGNPHDPSFFIKQAQSIAARSIAKATGLDPGTASVAHVDETGTRTEPKP